MGLGFAKHFTVKAHFTSTCIKAIKRLSVQTYKHLRWWGIRPNIFSYNMHKKRKALSSWLVEVTDYVLLLSVVKLVSYFQLKCYD
jgi:hypothetical protein